MESWNDNFTTVYVCIVQYYNVSRLAYIRMHMYDNYIHYIILFYYYFFYAQCDTFRH